MSNVLMIFVIIMLFITMISSLISMTIILKESKDKELIKKIFKIVGIALIIILVILSAIGASYIKTNDSGTIENKTVTLEEAGFNEITIDEYLELIKQPSKNVILVARPTCAYCEKFTPVLKQASSDMNVKINYIDTDKLTDETWSSFNNSFDIFQGDWGTPLVLVTSDGKLISKNEGYTDLSTIKKFFKDNELGE